MSTPNAAMPRDHDQATTAPKTEHKPDLIAPPATPPAPKTIAEAERQGDPRGKHVMNKAEAREARGAAKQH
jgi:hypothetical protein